MKNDIRHPAIARVGDGELASPFLSADEFVEGFQRVAIAVTGEVGMGMAFGFDGEFGREVGVTVCAHAASSK